MVILSTFDDLKESMAEFIELEKRNSAREGVLTEKDIIEALRWVNDESEDAIVDQHYSKAYHLEIAMRALTQALLNPPKERKCWNKGGCIFNSNNSPMYMKCWQDDYSVDECEKEYKTFKKENLSWGLKTFTQERLRHLKLALHVIFWFWIDNTVQKGMPEESNQEAKENYIKDLDDITNLIEHVMFEIAMLEEDN